MKLKIRLWVWRSKIRSVIRHTWWTWTTERERALEELERWRNIALERQAWAIEMRDALWQLKHPPCGAGVLKGALTVAADEIDGQAPNYPCESAWQEGDTGAWNCDREKRDETCWCQVASELREFDKGLQLHGDVIASREEPLRLCADVLTRHHQWHAAQTDPDPEHGYIPADEYADSSMYEQTVEALGAANKILGGPDGEAGR